MRLTDTLAMALANLRRRTVRTFLTIFGIFVGIVTIVTMTSMGVGVQMELVSSIREIGLETVAVFPRGAERDEEGEEEETTPFTPAEIEQPITPALIAELAALPGVASIETLVELPAGMDIRIRVGERESPLRIIRRGGEDIFEPDFEGEPEPSAGRLVQPGDARGVTLSTEAAARLGDPAALVGQAAALVVTTPRGEQTEVATEIVGVAPREGLVGYVGLEEKGAIKAWWYNEPDLIERRGYDALVVRATRIEEVPALIETIEARGLETQSLQQVLTLATRIFAVLQSLLASVGTLALFVASLGVVNTMIMAIYERTREIGVLKATGAAPGDIRRLFMVEAALMGVIGGITGVIAGTLLGRLVDWIAHRFLESEGVTGIGALSVVPPWLTLGAIAFGTLVGLLAGLYPAARAAALDPVQALRYD